MIRDRALSKKIALYMQKKTAVPLTSALGRFLVPHIYVGSIINAIVTHLSEYLLVLLKTALSSSFFTL